MAASAPFISDAPAIQIALHDLGAKGIVLPGMSIADPHSVHMPVVQQHAAAACSGPIAARNAPHDIADAIQVNVAQANSLHLFRQPLGQRLF